jgi:predicted ATPase/DNA-binding SARP family transcriptional activator
MPPGSDGKLVKTWPRLGRRADGSECEPLVTLRRTPTSTFADEGSGRGAVETRKPTVQILLLGPVELRIDGRDIALGGPRQRALLALLALRPGQILPADELVEEVWAGEPPEGADTTLRSYVSRLRRSLEGALSIERTDRGYVLRVPAEAVDALAFERLAREGSERLARGAARTARERLGAALGLWHGRPFGDLGREGALGGAADRLEELRLLALEQRIEADLALGRAAELVDEIEALLREVPFREQLWHHLMLALYRANRQADALAAFHRARAALDEELGLEPSSQLRELEAAILRQDVPEVARPKGSTNLPGSLTTFIGRMGELETVAALLASNRLVTLTGVGGVGKTRLALQAAKGATDRFPDGIWLVDLAPLADPSLVAASVATTLGIRVKHDEGAGDALATQLADRSLLVVLDNCEHLRDASAEVAAALVGRTSDAQVLATSRVALGVPGEVDYPVPPLALPADGGEAGSMAESEAVDLFLERARAARPSLPADAATLAAASRIVADLDGLPLAIELAAARAKAFTLADIAAGLSDRFRFLVSWRRLASARHRTLAEAMAWSFDLLTPDEQALLADLSVFAGSFDLDAIAEVGLGGDVRLARDLVQQLVDASLVILDADAAGGSRYRLLETVRQYAAERLASSGRAMETRAAHAHYFANLAETTQLNGVDQARAIARLDRERDNLRAAIEHTAAVGDRALQRQLTSRLWPYWHLRGFLAEGRARLAATLEHGPDVAPAYYPRALLGAGNMAWTMGLYDEGRRFGTELLELGEATGNTAVAHAGNRLLASIAHKERDFETSERFSIRAVELSRGLEDRMSAVMTELNHAVLIMDAGRIEPAVGMFEDVLDRFRAARHGEGVGLALLNLGEAAFLLGNEDDAHRRFVEARDAFESVGFRAHVGHAMQGLAAVEARDGDPAVAAELLGRADAIIADVGASADFNPGMVSDAAGAARAALGDDAYQSAYDAGWAREQRDLSR